MNQSCPECNNDGGFCNFCGNKPKKVNYNLVNNIIQAEDEDPYQINGLDLRVHHPTQPKTQVERWEEEIWENIWFITEHHGCYPFEDVACDLQGTDNCSHRMKVKIPELKNNIFLAKQHNPRVSALIGRYQTGTFADDKKDYREIEKELFTMVYQWGKIGVITNELCNAYQDKLKEYRDSVGNITR